MFKIYVKTMGKRGNFMVSFKLKAEEIKRLTDIKGGCLASNKITVDGEKVGYAYREESDKNFPDDSGWRFLSGTEDDSYLENPNNFNVFELNTICNYDGAILPILDSRVGSSFIRNDDILVKDSRYGN